MSDMLNKAREYEKNALENTPKDLRPAFHLASLTGWMNDPNGFSCYNGQYHLFYQYNPYSMGWASMHWAHAVTKDFVHWDYLPAALAPDMPYDAAGVFSGSAIEDQGRHVLMYTGVSEKEGPDGKKTVIQNQCLAVGDGLDYEKWEVNPVLTSDLLPEGSSREDFRDPKLWKEDGVYYAVAGSRSDDGSGQIPLFSSTDLKNWKLCSILDRSRNRYGRMWECPDFYPLGDGHVLMVSPQDMEAEGLEFHCGNNAIFLIGRYDKDNYQFTRSNVQAVDYGFDFYAPQTMETEDGRRIMIAWMKSWDAQICPEGLTWNGQMTFPRELEKRGDRIYQNPVKEIEAFRTDPVFYSDYSFSGSCVLDQVSGRQMDLTVEITGGDYKRFSLKFAADDRHYTEISYDPEAGILTFDRTYSGLVRDFPCVRHVAAASNQGRIKLRLLADKYSAEVFINDGESAFTALVPTSQEAAGVSFEAEGSVTMNVEKYSIV